ncbi:MAG: hypothetical protein HYV07_11940 [Deltaproteobacteria bacterium]|nr:hypothetical protein [Deltaproteobacteria bacterium]
MLWLAKVRGWFASRARARLDAAAIERLGLRAGGDAQGALELRGVRRGFEVAVTVLPPGLLGFGRGAEVRARGGARVGTFASEGTLPSGPATIPATLWINHPSPMGTAVSVGDEAFDGELAVFGDELFVVALMDESTRALLGSSCARWSLAVTGRELVVAVSDPTEAELEDALDVASELAERLSLAPRDVAARLAQNVARDSLVPVRLRNLELLLAHFPWASEARDASETAIRDSSHQVRLLGAISLGASGVEPLFTLMEDPRAPASIRERALLALLRMAPVGEGRPAFDARLASVLERVFESERDEARTMALLRLDSMGRRPDAGKIIEATWEADVDSAVAMLGTLRFTHDRSVEKGLVMLARRSAPRAAFAALEAIGRVGTVAVVADLRKVAETGNDPDVRREARRAIARIQSQVDLDAPGLLSFTSDQAGGELSRASEGELELTHGPPNRTERLGQASSLLLSSKKPGQAD